MRNMITSSGSDCKQTMQKILVVGSLNMDLVAYVEEMPAKGETVLSKSFGRAPGGKGANQAYAVGRLGAQVSMIGAVGNDENGLLLIDNLKKANVDVRAVTILEEAPTGCAHIAVDRHGNNSIIVIPGTNSLLTPAILDKHICRFDECGIVMLQLEIPIETVLYAAKLAKERGKTIILDPAPAVKDIPQELFQMVDIIKPNEGELATLTGMRADTAEHIDAASRRLLDRGVKAVIVTLGERGAMLVTSEGCDAYPVGAVDVVDTTAAGDSFIAALAYALSDGMDMACAIRTANEVSSIVVTRKGAQSSIPTMEEVRNRNVRNCPSGLSSR